MAWSLFITYVECLLKLQSEYIWEKLIPSISEFKVKKMYLFFLFVLGFILIKISLPFIYKLLLDAGMVKENFHHETVPAALGLVFPLTFPIILLVYQGLKYFGLSQVLTPGEFYAFLFFITGLGLLGLTDDILKDCGKGNSPRVG